MTDPMSQLPLAFHADPALDFASFVAGDNAAAIAALEAWSAGSDNPVIYLWGQEGCGKSHLLQAAVQAAGMGADDTTLAARAMYVPLAELVAVGPAALDALGTLDAIALDDLDRVAGDADWETALIGLYQATVSGGRRLLWAGSRPPREAFTLPDLHTRAEASLVFHLRQLGDADKQRLLENEARRRGLELAPQVAHYIMTRAARDTRSLLALMERLDRASLSEGRRLTLPFVRGVLDDPGR